MGGKVVTVLWKPWSVASPRALIALVPVSLSSTAAASLGTPIESAQITTFVRVVPPLSERL